MKYSKVKKLTLRGRFDKLEKPKRYSFCHWTNDRKTMYYRDL